MPRPSEDFSIGVEEEYQIVHPETRAPVPRAGRVLRRAREAIGDLVTNELYLSQIEIGTPVCLTFSEVRAQIVGLRREGIAAAEPHGWRIAASGTHPFSHWEDQEINPKDRYRGIAEEYQQRARESHARDAAEGSDPDPRPELLRAARWRAARYGLDGELVDLSTPRTGPAAEVVNALLAFVRPPWRRPGIGTKSRSWSE